MEACATSVYVLLNVTLPKSNMELHAIAEVP